MPTLLISVVYLCGPYSWSELHVVVVDEVDGRRVCGVGDS